MNCLRCNTKNEDGAKFCKNCGMNMNYTPSNEHTESKSSDNLLFIYLCLFFVIGFVAQTAIEKSVDNWYESPTKYIRSSLWILTNLSLILIPLAIKNKTLKIVGLIITSIMIIYWIYGNVDFMMN